jgi:hypothetical protein
MAVFVTAIREEFVAMFGRRNSSTGSQPPAPPSDPGSWQPYKKMDAALTAAICLFTENLEMARKDCGALGKKGVVPSNVAALLADSIIYPAIGGSEFATLGSTTDFKAFHFKPHFRLFMIINASLILQDLKLERSQRSAVVIDQVPRPLVDACLLKKWIKSIAPIGQAIAANRIDQFSALHLTHLKECVDIKRSVPNWITQQIDIEDIVKEWCSGAPAAIGLPLTADVKRMNNLPMIDIVAQQITTFLAEIQAQGMRSAG